MMERITGYRFFPTLPARRVKGAVTKNLAKRQPFPQNFRIFAKKFVTNIFAT